MMMASKSAFTGIFLSAYASLKLRREGCMPVQLLDFPCLVLEGMTIRTANEAARRLLGEDPAGRPFMALLDESARRVWRREVARRGGRSEYLGETGIVCRRGCVTVRALLLRGRRSFTLLLSPTGSVDTVPEGSADVFIRDGAALARDAANAVTADELADITHEMRTPLTVIRSAATLIRERPEASEQYIQGIERNCEALQRMICSILDLNRIESGGEINRTESELCQWLRNVIENLRPQAQCRGVELQLSGGLAELNAYTDCTLLEHIIVNLITNSLKFTPAGGRIDVHLALAGDRALITVADTGCGIPPEKLKRIFERHETSDTRRGAGLGLNIAARYAALLGGSLSAFSDGLSGSSFTLTLPLACAEKTKADICE